MTATPDDRPQHPGQPEEGGADRSAEDPLGQLPNADEWGGNCLTADEVAELTRQDWEAVDPDDPAWADDPETGPPPQWLAMPASERERLLAEEDERASRQVPEAIDAGFTHEVSGNGNGFAAGGPLDVMLPGAELGWHLGQAMRRPLAEYSDDELIGLMCANQRQRSWQAATEYKLAAELDRRRADPDGTPGEHVDAELAAGLTRTSWSASALLDLARDLRRLTKTMDLLTNGVIDDRRAQIIARNTALLSNAEAAKVEDLILPRAAAMTTGELNSACLRAVIKIDPAAARKRKEKALNDARVEAWSEPSGTAALAGRDLPPEQVVLADKYLDQTARWLKTSGVEGTHQQLRAMALTCLARGDTLDSLLPHSGQDPGSPDDPTHGTPSAADHNQAGNGQASCPATTSPGSSATGRPAAPLGGTVHLVMPYDTWTGRSDNPGDISGFGAADASTCRTLATHMTNPATRWCITLTDHHGRPAAHGCART